MTAREKLTWERLVFALTYCPITGVFVWAHSLSKNVPVGSVAGSMRKDGYTQICIDGRLYLGHRLAWMYMKGSFPPHTIDHVNGKKSDNRFNNLRPATASENGCNVGVRANSKTGVKGVYWCAAREAFLARLRIGGRKVSLGAFRSTDEAGEAIRKAREQAHGEFANHG